MVPNVIVHWDGGQQVRLFYTDHFELPLPDGHRFPMDKYRLLRQRVAQSEDFLNDPLLVPPAASDAQLLLCHTANYVQAVCNGKLTSAEIRRIGFPWSEKMVERSRRSTGATIAAARAALDEQIALNLAGGTHHAFADAGEGYCVFNDAAVAIRSLQSEGLIKRACVLDLDVHQGNGTASIFASDPSVFTVSIHGEKNFPLRKVASSLDINLPNGTTDAEYHGAVEHAIGRVQANADNSGYIDLVIYLAGADPYEHDRLGRLSLTKAGLRQRDEIVMKWAKNSGIPIVVVMAGGYAPNVQDIVDIHLASLLVAKNTYR